MLLIIKTESAFKTIKWKVLKFSVKCFLWFFFKQACSVKVHDDVFQSDYV